MKFIYCPECADVVSLQISEDSRMCKCKSSWGRYIDERKAVIGGNAISFGISNTSFHAALRADQFTFEGFFYAPYGWCETPDVQHEDEQVAKKIRKNFEEILKHVQHQNSLLTKHTRNWIYHKVIDQVPRVQDYVCDGEWFEKWLWEILNNITKEKDEESLQDNLDTQRP